MQMQVCIECGIEKDLQTSFYAHPKTRNGYSCVCKDCHKGRMKRRRQENTAVQEYDRFRYHNDPKRKAASKASARRSELANPERAAERKRKYAENNRELISRRSYQWMKQNPEKKRAYEKVCDAIRGGHLSKQPCVVCGSINVHAHHEDYTKPLDVIWLCPQHHKDIHSKVLNSS